MGLCGSNNVNVSKAKNPTGQSHHGSNKRKVGDIKGPTSNINTQVSPHQRVVTDDGQSAGRASVFQNFSWSNIELANDGSKILLGTGLKLSTILELYILRIRFQLR
jgi:hypothetical protein